MSGIDGGGVQVPGSVQLSDVTELRNAREFRRVYLDPLFSEDTTIVLPKTINVHPVSAFVSLFERVPAPATQANIAALLADAARAPRGRRVREFNGVIASDAPGYVYMIVVSSNDPTLVKVGRTQRSPEKRAAELRAQFNALSAQPIAGEYTKRCALVERIMHALLAEWRQVPVTADRLAHLEFFRLAQPDTTSRLLRAVALFANNY